MSGKTGRDSYIPSEASSYCPEGSKPPEDSNISQERLAGEKAFSTWAFKDIKGQTLVTKFKRPRSSHLPLVQVHSGLGGSLWIACCYLIVDLTGLTITWKHTSACFQKGLAGYWWPCPVTWVKGRRQAEHQRSSRSAS